MRQTTPIFLQQGFAFLSGGRVQQTPTYRPPPPPERLKPSGKGASKKPRKPHSGFAPGCRCANCSKPECESCRRRRIACVHHCQCLGYMPVAPGEAGSSALPLEVDSEGEGSYSSEPDDGKRARQVSKWAALPQREGKPRPGLPTTYGDEGSDAPNPAPQARPHPRAQSQQPLSSLPSLRR
jgi:hypothetical protein